MTGAAAVVVVVVVVETGTGCGRAAGGGVCFVGVVYACGDRGGERERGERGGRGEASPSSLLRSSSRAMRENEELRLE